MEELERTLRKACPSIMKLPVQRTLVYDRFHEEFLDDPDHILTDKDKIAFHFDMASSTCASPSTASATRTTQFTRQSTLVFGRDGLKISASPPKVQDTLSEKELEEKAKIFGKSGKKPLTKYQKSMNDASSEIVKKDPTIAENRGELYKQARLMVHNSGYQYAHGKKTRSKYFGSASQKISDKGGNYSRKACRDERLTELTERCSSLEKQIGFLEKSQEKALNSSLFDQAANLERQISSARLEKRRLEKEKKNIEAHTVKLEKRRVNRKRRRGGKGGGEKKGKKVATVQRDSSTEPDSSSEVQCLGIGSGDDDTSMAYDTPGSSQSSTLSATDMLNNVQEGVTEEEDFQ